MKCCEAIYKSVLNKRVRVLIIHTRAIMGTYIYAFFYKKEV
jgi:hypothetical protein